MRTQSFWNDDRKLETYVIFEPNVQSYVPARMDKNALMYIQKRVQV